MDPRYAFFIWTSFGIAAAAVLWNVIAPKLARNELRRQLSEGAEDSTEGDA